MVLVRIWNDLLEKTFTCWFVGLTILYIHIKWYFADFQKQYFKYMTQYNANEL